MNPGRFGETQEQVIEETIGEWYILRNNNHAGPYSQKRILEFYHQEAISEYSLIWKEGFKDWLPLKK